jgi:hypothetical protein
MIVEKLLKKKSIFDKYKEMPTKVKVKEIGKVFIFAFCIFGLSYQTYQLVLQYRSGTIVNLYLTFFRTSRLPAITICYPMFTSMEKIAKLYPEFRDEFEKYQNISKYINPNYSDYDYKNQTEYLDSIRKKFNDHSIEALKLMSAFDAFDNISIPFILNGETEFNSGNNSENKKINSQKFVIEAIVKGFHGPKNSRKIVEFRDNSPIESITSKYEKFMPRKCFTFFSEFNQKWKEFKIHLEDFKFIVNFDKNWFPNDYEKKNLRFYFSMHSQNTFPRMDFEDNYLELESGHSYSISFTRIRSKLLPPNYTTNCRRYNSSNIKEAQSGSDCHERCVLRILNQTCGQCIHHFGVLLRKQLLKEYETEKFCNFEWINKTKCNNNILSELRLYCRKDCQYDCDKQIINFNVKRSDKLSKSESNMKTIIHISHSRLPDQKIEYLPEMSFVSFIANFGGLAGMWLGLSAIALYDFVFKYL